MNEDEEIIWIKELILKHGDSRPKITEFANTKQRILYKQYSSLRVKHGILYSQSEYHNGISRIQLVLPKKAIIEVLDKIH